MSKDQLLPVLRDERFCEDILGSLHCGRVTYCTAAFTKEHHDQIYCRSYYTATSGQRDLKVKSCAAKGGHAKLFTR